ncbi:hypothetical protein PS15m_003192 [Mucor circinelloides]
MIESCKFIFTHHLNSLFYFPSSMDDLLNMLFYNYLDSFITLYHTQYPFYITPSDNINQKNTTVNEPALAHKKPNLLIDTTKKDLLFCKSRHNTFSFNDSDYCHHHQHPQSAYPDVPQLLFSPTSSVSSSSSNFYWSPDDNNYTGSKRSQVEDMIHWFEHGHRYMEQRRRHSVDSHWHCRKRVYIRERRYEYQPTVGEWKKRINGEFPMQLSESKSTPIQPSKRRMAPIMEASKSLWA